MTCSWIEYYLVNSDIIVGENNFRERLHEASQK